MTRAVPDAPYILIVDDEADQRLLSRRMLERAEVRHPIVEIGGGAQAIAYLAACCSGDGSPDARPPVLIFLDLKMPGVDGFAVLRWVRSQAALHHVKVIVLTSSENAEDVKTCSRLGAQAFLMKHPNPAVMGCVLRQALAETPEARPIPASAEATDRLMA